MNLFTIVDENYYNYKTREFEVTIDVKSRYFNIYNICEKDEFYKWCKNEEDLLNKCKNIYSTDPFYEIYEDINEINQISGIYLCKELFLKLCSNLSNDLFIECIRMINEFSFIDINNVIKEKEDQISTLINGIQELTICNNKLYKEHSTFSENVSILKKELDTSATNVKNLQLQLEKTYVQLNKILPHRNIEPINKRLQHYYILFKDNSEQHNYIFIRGQHKYIQSKKIEYKDLYTIKLNAIKTPNPIDLTNRLKERIKMINGEQGDEKIIYKLNKITLKNYEEEKFLNVIKTLNDDKYIIE